MYGRIKNIHFIGIGGIGMSGIAEVLINMGYKVSGSDIKSSKIIKRLDGLGAEISIGHKKNNVKGKDVVVFSSIIRDNNPVSQYIMPDFLDIFRCYITPAFQESMSFGTKIQKERRARRSTIGNEIG